MCDFRDWLLVKVTEWCSRSLVLSLKLLFFTWMRVLVPMCVRAKSLQACLTLCDPMDCSLASSSAHEILQARILEWVTMPSSWGSFQPRDQICVSYASCIGRWILYHCTTWEAHILYTVVCILEKAMAPHSGTLAWKIPWM